jgi:hypothetical protein
VAHMTSALQDKSAVKVSIVLGRLYVRADLPQPWPCSRGENAMTTAGAAQGAQRREHVIDGLRLLHFFQPLVPAFLHANGI